MSELHKFLFDGLPVRGVIVRLTDAWTEILARRSADDAVAAWPWPVAELVGEMAAAGALMQANIKFNGALVMQVFGDGPVKVRYIVESIDGARTELPPVEATLPIPGGVIEGPILPSGSVGGSLIVEIVDSETGQTITKGASPIGT